MLNNGLFDFSESEQNKIDLKIAELLFKILYKNEIITIKEYNDLLKELVAQPN